MNDSVNAGSGAKGGGGMSQHFYPQCAHLVLVALDHQSSLKSIVSNHCPVGARFTLAAQKRYLATVISLLAWRNALQNVIKAAGSVEGDKQVKRTLSIAWNKYVEDTNADRTRKPSSKHLTTNNDDASRELLLVLTHELICSPSKRISTSPSWPPHRIVASHRPRLQAELIKLQIKEGKRNIDELRSDHEQRMLVSTESGGWERGRWVRVNNRKTNLDAVREWLLKHGYQQHEGSCLPAETAKRKAQKSFLVPSQLSHPKDVMLFPLSVTAELVASDLYTSGQIVLQDAASCWPAQLLLSPLLAAQGDRVNQDIHVMDATAAPGNKTSHLSSLISSMTASDKGSVRLTALERDPQRYKVLQSQLERFGCLLKANSTSTPRSGKPTGQQTGLVEAHHADFLSMDSSSLADVTHMLLDPSCSGSGITGRLDWLTTKNETSENDNAEADTATDSEEERLRKLSDVQLRMIEHAFVSCPKLERLVYSTCSVHHQEDEDVVFRALESPHARGKTWRWTVASRHDCLPDWPWRGEEGAQNQTDEEKRTRQGMLRAYPYAAIQPPEGGATEQSSQGQGRTHALRTNGFFAACFVKEPIQRVTNALESFEKTEHPDTQGNATAQASSDAKRRKRQRQKDNKRRRLAGVSEVLTADEVEWEGCSEDV
ncbi:unnamed protein product [Parajaminaea phylloscopi]